MAFSRSGVSKVACPIRLGLIMGFSSSRPGDRFFRGRIFYGKPEVHFSGKCSAGKLRGHAWLIFRHQDRTVNAGGYTRRATPSTTPFVSAKALAATSTARREQTQMAGYKIATYKTPDGPRAGLVI